ncbi:MAG TPA: hypothetical protein VF988_17170 [Verrucomicrobiae bacterium]
MKKISRTGAVAEIFLRRTLRPGNAVLYAALIEQFALPEKETDVIKRRRVGTFNGRDNDRQLNRGGREN